MADDCKHEATSNCKTHLCSECIRTVEKQTALAIKQRLENSIRENIRGQEIEGSDWIYLHDLKTELQRIFAELIKEEVD